MSYNLEQLSADCHDAMKSDAENGPEQIRQNIEKALANPEFVEKHLGPDNDTGRQVIYEDPEFGFCILAHVYKGERNSPPHDHGPAWAIYGQAKGVTEMTEYKLVKKPEGEAPGEVEPVETYDLEPGMARLYKIGQLHSPRRESETRLIRVEGRNMEGVKRDKFVAAA